MTLSNNGSANWLRLLDDGLQLLRSLQPEPEWSVGGGTVLMWYYGHRESRDIDIFLKDAQYLTQLSPRLNAIAESLSVDYVEASNFLKLTRPEGEIDFIVAPDLSDDPNREFSVEGRQLRTETAVEIVLKKAFYRAVDFRIRDVFDLAVVLDRDREAVERNAGVLAGKTATLRARIKSMEQRFEREAAKEISVLPAGKHYLASAIRVVSAFFDSLR